MELNQLKYFAVTAQLQNMSKAAQILGIAQPSLSKSIASLENELGTQLFDRSGKKLILNERGKRYLESVVTAIDELENAASDARSRLADYTINVGLFCMSERLIRCLGDYSSRNPGFLYNVNHLFDSPERIDTNEYDVLLYPREALYRRYKGHFAYTEKYLLAVHRDDPIAAKNSVGLSELSGSSLIFIKQDTKEYDNTYTLYRNLTGEKGSYSFCNSYALQRLMVSSSMGSGFVPEESASAYSGDERISLIPIADEGFERDIFMGFKREKHLSEHGRLLMAFIMEYFGLDTEG